MAESGIITGQYVRIQPTVASVGDRIFAQLIDWGVLLAYIALLTWFVVETNISGWVVATLYLFPLLFYTLICEVLNQGQTLGKMVLNIRVVKMDGSMPTLGAYLMRWMLWLIDGPATSCCHDSEPQQPATGRHGSWHGGYQEAEIQEDTD